MGANFDVTAVDLIAQPAAAGERYRQLGRCMLGSEPEAISSKLGTSRKRPRWTTRA